MNKKSKFEAWNPFDERLPEKLMCMPPDATFIEAVCERQLQPVGVALLGDEYHFMFGNRRLYAIRKGYENNPKLKVGVQIFEVESMSELAALRSQENALRSPNVITDVMTLKTTLGQTVQDENGENMIADYKYCATLMGRSIQYVKKIDKEWSKLPKASWVMDALLAGTMSAKTALALGGFDDKEILKQAKDHHKQNGKLPYSWVQSLRKIRVAQVTDDTMSGFFAELGNKKKEFYRRDEVETIKKYADAGDLPSLIVYLNTMLEE